MAKKIYVLDTNVYLTDPDAIYMFGINDIVIPFKVLEEADKLKKRSDNVGANARRFIRTLDHLREKGSLLKGVRIAKGKGILSVKSATATTTPNELDLKVADNEILAVALNCAAEQIISNQSNLKKVRKVIVVSRDINMRVKCDAYGIMSETYDKEQILNSSSQLYSGFTSLLVDDQIIDTFYKGEEEVYLQNLVEKDKIKIYAPNEFIMLISNSNEKKTALSRFKNINSPLLTVGEHKKGLWNIRAKNKEQAFALDLLLDPEVGLITLVGSAGVGKTLLALAAGLDQTVSRRAQYSRMIVSRPIHPMGRDLGYLPGPQPYDAKILTPGGWKTMGELKVGDLVINSSGNESKITKIHEKGIKEVFKITTHSGLKTEACLDHLWETMSWEDKKRSREGTVKSTKEIKQTLLNKNGKLNHYLPRNKAVKFKYRVLPIEPYTMGALLGDGCFSNSINISSTDIDIIKRIEKEIMKNNCVVAHPKNGIIFNIRSNLYNNKPARNVKITNIKTRRTFNFKSIGQAYIFVKEHHIENNLNTFKSRVERNLETTNFKYEFTDKNKKWMNPIKEEIDKMDLLFKKSYEKFIPEQYKYCSIKQRLSLIQGLMDTDGNVKKNGEANFTTTSLRLAKDLAEIIRSLGGSSKIKTRDRTKKPRIFENRIIQSNRKCYYVRVSLPEIYNPFYIKRKAERYKKSYIYNEKILSIESVGTKRVKCITIDSLDHLYITDDYIITHNSLEEKMRPWIAPIEDNLKFMLERDQKLDELIQSGIIEIEALTYIRGRSIPHAFIIIDEAQNLTKHELKTMITRVGEGTKIVLTGDIDQIDNVFVNELTNGLTNAVEKFRTENFAGHVTLKKGERSKIATAAAKIL